VHLKTKLLHKSRGDAMLGAGPAVERLREQIARVARTGATALILGESGTEKELVADAVHYGSTRAEAPLVKVNCAAIPVTLLEAELFGHERGAYTGAHDRRKGRFELADGGTLFLDEIGEMPLPLQAKLLRILQKRTFERLGGSEAVRADVRLVCATNQDLERKVRDGRFREDLHYRIHVVPIVVPPLRGRPEDILLLAQHFANEAGARNGRPTRSIAPDAADELRAHPWPGNVRQLRNVIERAVILGNGPVLERRDLDLAPPPPFPASPVPGGGDGRLLDRLLHSELAFEEFEGELLVLALRRTHGNRSRAARLLGVTRRTLQYRIAKFRIDTAALCG